MESIGKHNHFHYDGVLGEVSYAIALLRLDTQNVNIVYKRDSFFWKHLKSFVNFISFGKISNCNKFSSTTFGNTIYLCDVFDDLHLVEKADIIVHELTHIKQYKKLSIPLFLLLYCIPYGRYVLEREAFYNGYKMELVGLNDDQAKLYAMFLADDFSNMMASFSYGFAWPFRKTTYKWMLNKLLLSIGVKND